MKRLRVFLFACVPVLALCSLLASSVFANELKSATVAFETFAVAAKGQDLSKDVKTAVKASAAHLTVAVRFNATDKAKAKLHAAAAQLELLAVADAVGVSLEAVDATLADSVKAKKKELRNDIADVMKALGSAEGLLQASQDDENFGQGWCFEGYVPCSGTCCYKETERCGDGQCHTREGNNTVDSSSEKETESK